MNILNLPGASMNASMESAPGFNASMLRLMVLYAHLPGPGKRMATTAVQLLTHYLGWMWGLGA